VIEKGYILGSNPDFSQVNSKRRKGYHGEEKVVDDVP
jgi:hypothetical protein